jgi:2-oxoglutarate ferredoxin oxidoreductase subunit alpha
MRVKAFPFNEEVRKFIAEHERIFVVEQNRDAQFKSLLVNELGINPQKIVSVLNYDGYPITADLIRQKIFQNLLGKLKPAFVEHEVGAPNESEVSE